MIYEVLSMLTGETIMDSSNVIEQGWHDSQPFMTGCLIKTSNVYSICPGIVINIGVDDKNNLYSVTVEYDSQTWVRYCMLGNVSVNVGDSVEFQTKIGTSHKNLIRFEYCTPEVSNFPVRELTSQLYRQDPTPVLFSDGLFFEVN